MKMSGLGKLTWLAALALGAVTAASFLGGLWWAFDLAAHFRPQLAVLSFAAALVAGLTRARLAAGLLLAALVANGLPLAARLADARANDCGAPHGLRLLSLNLQVWGTSPAAFQRLIDVERPDIVLLTELPRDLAPLTDAMPELAAHALVDRRGSIFDVALFSRWPVASWSVDRSVSIPSSAPVTDVASFDRSISSLLPVLIADICPPSGAAGAPSCLRVVGLHAAQPMQGGGRWQDAQLSLAARAAAAAPGGRAVLMGDLNLTPWSPRFGRLLAESGLADTSLQRPFEASWRSPLPFVDLALDHLLASPGLVVPCNRLGADVGSDHLPVIADVGVANGAAP